MTDGSVKTSVFDNRVCGLGESPVWHPLRDALFWVDIPDQTLMMRGRSQSNSWRFDEMVSAVGWIDENRLLAGTETGLCIFRIDDGSQELLCQIEADLPGNRSNDGRADPWGGFWLSTMDKNAASGCGAIYRWHRGEQRQVVDGLTIPNGICFDRARSVGYYADTASRKIFVQKLNPEDGWPVGPPQLFLDLTTDGIDMDGAIIDSEGCMWSAIWDGSCLLRIGPDAKLLETIELPVSRPTCPAFGGTDSNELYVTSAAIGLDNAGKAGNVHGMTLYAGSCPTGVAAPRVEV